MTSVLMPVIGVVVMVIVTAIVKEKKSNQIKFLIFDLSKNLNKVQVF